MIDMIVIPLIAGILSMWFYRWIGGAYIGGKAAEHKWYNSRGIPVALMMILFTYRFHQYIPQPLWQSILDSIIWVSCYRLIGYDSYTDFGINKQYDDEFTAPLMRKLFKEKDWGSWIYDFTGLIFRFGIFGFLFFVYKTTQLYLTYGFLSLQVRFLFLGLAPAFIYWFATTFEDKNPDIFDKFRTSKITDPLNSNRFIQKDKDLAEAMIGFLCGFII